MRIIYIFFLVVALLGGGCAKKPPLTPKAQITGEELADIRSIPQNLEIFARETGPDKRFLSRERQLRLADNFISTLTGPWHMAKTSIPKRDAAGDFGRAWGYRQDSIRWSQAEMDALKANANLASYPSRNLAAITVRPTDLRALPTTNPRYKNPVPDPLLDPFDYLQYSFLPIGTPLLIAHTSLDGKWHYVECPIAGGWVQAEDTAIAGPEFRQTWQTGAYAALIAENVNLPGAGKNGKDGKAGVGTVLPIVRESGQNLHVLIPIKEKNGQAGTAEVMLSRAQATRQPMQMTPANVAKVGNTMMGQKYGWGGMLGLRDCSAMIRDLFAPFGIWLPRNSRAQSRRGAVISLAGKTLSEKEQIIMADGVPFLSLIGLPGHITLYVGKWKNRPCIFHNAWGVRIVKDGNDDERFVIGRTVITSISPGAELENLYRPVTFTDRIRTLTTTRNEH